MDRTTISYTGVEPSNILTDTHYFITDKYIYIVLLPTASIDRDVKALFNQLRFHFISP